MIFIIIAQNFLNETQKKAMLPQETEISRMRVRAGNPHNSKREKQRLWLKRPMTQRLIFHGKSSEESLVILEGRAPAQATGDGTRLVKIRQATLSREGEWTTNRQCK